MCFVPTPTATQRIFPMNQKIHDDKKAGGKIRKQKTATKEKKQTATPPKECVCGSKHTNRREQRSNQPPAIALSVLLQRDGFLFLPAQAGNRYDVRETPAEIIQPAQAGLIQIFVDTRTMLVYIKSEKLQHQNRGQSFIVI